MSDLIYGILLILGGCVCFIIYIKKPYPKGESHGLNFRLIVSGVVDVVLGVILLKDWIFSFFR